MKTRMQHARLVLLIVGPAIAACTGSVQLEDSGIRGSRDGAADDTKDGGATYVTDSGPDKGKGDGGSDAGWVRDGGADTRDSGFWWPDSGTARVDAGPISPAEAGRIDAGPIDAGPRTDSGPSCVPRSEICNGVDDDCDGYVDEEITRECTTACGSGTERCSGGSWLECSAPTRAEETCDGRDNDCDGQVDEGLSRGCSSVCGSGTETCSSGRWGACSAPAPSSETCDGADNDCDGRIDEGLSRACSSACGSGTETCSSGRWGTCTAPAPGAETCDGRDNDCDGRIDEDLSRACSSACGSGTETCSSGRWGTCSAPAPSTETCDGRDNDCDGRIDEDLSRGCSSACGSGTETCSSGRWGTCSAPAPSTESCDGRDNDCDGQIDEDLTRACATCGQAGVEQCVSGRWGSCSATPPREVCNLRDDDCDGECDEVTGCRIAVHRAYRRFGESYAETFYSTNWSEVSSMEHRHQNYFYFLSVEAPGTTPVYRCYRPTNHTRIYAFDTGCAGISGMVLEGRMGWLANSPTCGAVPLYHLYNSAANGGEGTHLFTRSTVERDARRRDGWGDHGIAGYVWDRP